MNLGDLVRWQSAVFQSAECDYANPGIVIKLLDDKRSVVLWADKRSTEEHNCFLKVLTTS